MSIQAAIDNLKYMLKSERHSKCHHPANRKHQLEKMAALVLAIRALKRKD